LTAKPRIKNENLLSYCFFGVDVRARRFADHWSSMVPAHISDVAGRLVGNARTTALDSVQHFE
jgi:hypothetical protein